MVVKNTNITDCFREMVLAVKNDPILLDLKVKRKQIQIDIDSRLDAIKKDVRAEYSFDDEAAAAHHGLTGE